MTDEMRNKLRALVCLAWACPAPPKDTRDNYDRLSDAIIDQWVELTGFYEVPGTVN